MGYFAYRAIEAFLTPPGLMFMMILAGFLFGSRFARLGRGLILSGLLLLLLASLPASSLLVYSLLESDPPLNQTDLLNTRARAIIILGGGRYAGLEYNKETVSIATLERLHYGAWLHQQTGLPILVTGGSVRGEATSEARLMAQTLTARLRVRPEWIEENSRNTWENAKFSRELLQKYQIDNILLVTHASHMKRANVSFSRQGFSVTPAPLGFKSRTGLRPAHFLPNAHALANLQRAGHEWLGRLWYSIHY